MGWFGNLFQKTVEIEFVDEQGRKQTKRVSQRDFDALMTKAVAEGKATVHDGCTAHILDPMHGVQIQNWIVGDRITREAYEKFKDGKGNVYVLAVYEKGEANLSLVPKAIWDQAKQHFADIEDESNQAMEQVKRDLFGGKR